MQNLTKDSVGRIHSDLVLSGISNESLRVSEADIRRRSSVTLVIGNDFDAIVLPDSDARVRGSEIDSDRRSLTLSGHCSL